MEGTACSKRPKRAGVTGGVILEMGTMAYGPMDTRCINYIYSYTVYDNYDIRNIEMVVAISRVS